MVLLGFLVLVLGFAGHVLSFDLSRKDNLAVYWGQDASGTQNGLATYCDSPSVDIIPLAFLYTFFGPSSAPLLDLSNICSSSGNEVFPGTKLANCAFLTADIEYCQGKGKAVTLSLGGAQASVGFVSDEQAIEFADTIWEMFLGGNSSVRPFGTAVLDGVDLDIESGKPDHYAVFVNRIRSLELLATSEKHYLITAAPQCPFPDEYIGATLSSVPFDAIYVQFYNNYCGLNYPESFNFATWDTWARTTFPFKTPKIFIGAPAAPSAAGQGYVSADALGAAARDAMSKYSTFGGVMLWDASEAWANGRYDTAVKDALTNAAKDTNAGRKARRASRLFRLPAQGVE